MKLMGNLEIRNGRFMAEGRKNSGVFHSIIFLSGSNNPVV